MTGQKISIITPVWNGSDLTADFLGAHFGRYSNRRDIEHIIIDNGSTDPTPYALAYWQNIMGDKLKIIRNEANEGYSVANNQGAAQATGDILVFMNNDVLIKGDYLTPIDQALNSAKIKGKKAMIGAQLITFDTGWNKFGDVLVYYLVGWCLAIPKADFLDLGGFDERYSPADYDDIDLSRKAAKNGYQLKELNLPLIHLGNQTGKHLTERRQITEANRVKFAKKWGLTYET